MTGPTRGAAKRWCFTVNNPSTEEEEELEKLKENLIYGITFIIVGREKGSEKETPHWQGYVEFSLTLSLRDLKEIAFLKRAHLEKARGSGIQNVNYCSKENSVILSLGEMAVRTRQGKRSDLEEALDALKNGATLKQLWEEHTAVMVKYEKGIKRAHTELTRTISNPEYTIEEFKMNPEDFTCLGEKTVILWGESGSGKTSLAHALMPTALIVSHMDDLAEFDPSIHEGIIFDDMDFKHFPRTAQIHLSDCAFDRSIHIRYTTAKIPKATKKIITTNEHEGNVLLLNDPAIRRRIKIIKML